MLNRNGVKEKKRTLFAFWEILLLKQFFGREISSGRVVTNPSKQCAVFLAVPGLTFAAERSSSVRTLGLSRDGLSQCEGGTEGQESLL